MEDKEFEKHLERFETIEPSGATDRKVLEMARKHTLETLSTPRRARRFRSLAVVALLALTVEGLFFLVVGIVPETVAYAGVPKGGMLAAVDPKGRLLGVCPLRHTKVEAEVSGFVAKVTVKQEFHNPFKDKIEAVYTFPLSAGGAVDSMLMKVGDRVIRGVIKRRETARRIYERAKASGRIASLLDQERPNIFTQSVANIGPGERIDITIEYVEMLPYEDGKFTFSFPMVVGPRFMPGGSAGESGTGWSPDTTEVPDASKISPPVTPPKTRAGHDIDITVKLNAGVPVKEIKSRLHEVVINEHAAHTATIRLKNGNTIPNKDFVLEYTVAGEEVKSGCLVHKKGKYGYLTVILLPPERPRREQIAPKEMIFVVDRSGSQTGEPIEKAKETMSYILGNMNPNDTFNIISFSNAVEMLFESPKTNSPEAVAEARRYMSTLDGNGGTYMAPAIVKACENPAPENRLRIVTFMTDGYIGNDFEVLDLVRKLRGSSRWFPFGTGNSVNRFLLDSMAKLGGGEVEYILLNSPGKEVARKFYNRISTPILTDIRVEFEGLEVEERHPGTVSDLWAQKPLYFHARYTKAGKGAIILKGFLGGKPYEQRLEIELPQVEDANEMLGSVWARAKVDSLMEQNLMDHQTRTPTQETREEIIKVALEHHIMTQYTSFVAVEDKVSTDPEKKPRKVPVPVEMPDGVSRKGVFGPTGMPPKRPKTAAAPTNSDTKCTLVHDPKSQDFSASPTSGDAPLSATFTADTTSGDAPLTVNFTETSTGAATSWEWDFGSDGETNAPQNPSHTYTSAGTYTVTLSVTGPSGSSSPTITNCIIADSIKYTVTGYCGTGDMIYVVDGANGDDPNDGYGKAHSNQYLRCRNRIPGMGAKFYELVSAGGLPKDYAEYGGCVEGFTIRNGHVPMPWSTAGYHAQSLYTAAELSNNDLRRIYWQRLNLGLDDDEDDDWRVVTLASERQARRTWTLVLCILVCVALAGAAAVILLRRRGKAA